jgi:hypothetical protein
MHWKPILQKEKRRCKQSRLIACEGKERLYCKRPIPCLASSKILAPPPPTARRVCSVCWVERGWGGGQYFGRPPDTALYSTYVSTLWFKQSHEWVLGSPLIAMAAWPREAQERVHPHCVLSGFNRRVRLHGDPFVGWPLFCGSTL